MKWKQPDIHFQRNECKFTSNKYPGFWHLYPILCSSMSANEIHSFISPCMFPTWSALIIGSVIGLASKILKKLSNFNKPLWRSYPGKRPKFRDLSQMMVVKKYYLNITFKTQPASDLSGTIQISAKCSIPEWDISLYANLILSLTPWIVRFLMIPVFLSSKWKPRPEILVKKCLNFSEFGENNQN